MNIDLLIEQYVFGREVAGAKVITSVGSNSAIKTFRDPLKWSKDESLAREVVRTLEKKGIQIEISYNSGIYIAEIKSTGTNYISASYSEAVCKCFLSSIDKS